MLNETELEQIKSILKEEILKYEIESDIFTTSIVIKPKNSFVLIDSFTIQKLINIKNFVLNFNNDFTIILTF